MNLRLVKAGIIIVLFILYFKLFSWIWNFTGIGVLVGDIGVLFGSLAVLLTCGILSVLTSEKVIEVIRRG